MQNGVHFIRIGVGTPPQYLDVQVDTGSSDFWLMSSTACQDSSNKCSDFGAYDKDASTSKEPVLTKESAGSNSPVLQPFRADYLDKSYAAGDAYKEKMTIGGRSVAEVQFGLAYQYNQGIPQLGLGFEEAQAGVRTGTAPLYPGLIQTLVDQKIIRVKAFSLWLGQDTQAPGSLLFGGVDTAKLDGDLTTLKVQANDVYPGGDVYLVQADSIIFRKSTDSKNPKSFSGLVMLDSGQTLTYLPDDLVASIWEETKAQFYQANDRAARVPFVECGLSSIFVDFNFGPTKIQIPISKFVYHDAGAPKNGPQCLLSIQPISKVYRKGKGQPILGVKFLQNAYVVHDLKNRQVSIAKLKFTSASAVVELGPEGVGALNLEKSEGEAGDKELEPEAEDTEEGTLTTTNPSSDDGNAPKSGVGGGPGIKDSASLPLSATSDVSKADPEVSNTNLFAEANPTENIYLGSDGTQAESSSTSEGSNTVGLAPEELKTPSILSYNQPSTEDRGASLFDGTEYSASLDSENLAVKA